MTHRRCGEQCGDRAARSWACYVTLKVRVCGFLTVEPADGLHEPTRAQVVLHGLQLVFHNGGIVLCNVAQVLLPPRRNGSVADASVVL